MTHNASQPVHLLRPWPPQSLALLQRLLTVGRVANKLVSIYPSQKWHGTSSPSCRFLTIKESYRLRRAIYRLWLYTKAFHLSSYTRQTRLQPPIVRSRAALLRPWAAPELAEMLDAHNILRALLAYHICPSNGTVLRRYKARYPHEQNPVITPAQPRNGSTLRMELEYQAQFFHGNPQVSKMLSGADRRIGSAMALEGWGDEIGHYYVVEDMLKLSPDHIVWLFEHVNNTAQTPTSATSWLDGEVDDGLLGAKDKVKGFVEAVGGEWFENNGETFGETVAFVMGQRGEEMQELRQAVEEGEMGVVRGAYW